MIKFNSNLSIIGLDSSYTEGEDLIVSLYFNSKHTIISPKSVFDVIYMFNGFFNADDIKFSNFGHKDINSEKIIKAVLDYGIVSDYDVSQYSTAIKDRFYTAQNRMREYTVHFPQISNINVMIAVLLQKLCVKCVFYKDDFINSDDVSQNIYYKHKDIGKSFISVLKEEIGTQGIYFESSSFDMDKLNENKDIIVNSDYSNWIDSDKCIVINTWNYSKISFEDFRLFNYKKIDISDDLKPLTNGYILAIRSIDDMVYNLRSGSIS